MGVQWTLMPLLLTSWMVWGFFLPRLHLREQRKGTRGFCYYPNWPLAPTLGSGWGSCSFSGNLGEHTRAINLTGHWVWPRSTQKEAEPFLPWQRKQRLSPAEFRHACTHTHLHVYTFREAFPLRRESLNSQLNLVFNFQIGASGQFY